MGITITGWIGLLIGFALGGFFGLIVGMVMADDYWRRKMRPVFDRNGNKAPEEIEKGD